MNRSKVVFGLLGTLLIGLCAAMFWCSGPVASHAEQKIFVYCAAVMSVPMALIAEQYEKEYGVHVQVLYGGSGSLLSNLDVGQGDLYLAADASYIEIARKKGVVETSFPIAFLTGGLGVQKGNPRNITSLPDLKRKGLRIGLANPDAASIGKFSKDMLVKYRLWEIIKEKVLVFKPTVTDLANDLKLGVMDVAILWDATARHYPEIDFIHLPEWNSEKKEVRVGLLRSSPHPAEALRFARYISSRNRGGMVFKALGYDLEC